MTPNGYNVSAGGQLSKNKANPEKYICPSCKKEKDSSAILCLSCRKEKRKSEIKIPQEDFSIKLVERILDSSLEQVAREYGYTSGNSLKRQLINNGYPGKREELFLYYEQKTGIKHWRKQEEERKKITREKQAPKKVGQYNLEEKLIAIYSSTQEARRQGYSSGHISECCRGKRKKYKGYIWKYL